MVRVLSYNVEHSGHRHPATLDAIAAAKADVALLQETTPAWERVVRARFAREYPHLSFHHARATGGLAVLSRAPVLVDELLPPPDWYPAQRLVLDTAAGPLQILHVHLRPMIDGGDWVRGYFTTPPIRRREIETFWAALDPALPTVVAGDFNEEPGGQALAFLAERGLHRVAPNGPSTWEWKGRYRGTDVHLRLNLDHILVDPRLAGHDAVVLDAGASDHRPVVVSVAPCRATVASSTASASSASS